MSQLAAIESAQKSLEDIFTKRMGELEAQIQCSAPAKDTVGRLAEEFRTFRALVFSMLGLIRRQIDECAKTVDMIETRHRRKALVFIGVPEVDKENCTELILGLLRSKLDLQYSASSIKSCHRLGSHKSDQKRPILVRFSSSDLRSAVWRVKTKLKGTNITVKEYLTKARQTTFARARLHFGVKGCWTQEGVIVIKVADGSRVKITSLGELEPLMLKHPKLGAANQDRVTKGSTSSSASGTSNITRNTTRKN